VIIWSLLLQGGAQIQSAATAYVLDTTPATYNITGSAATTLFDRITSVTPGAYNITGNNTTLLFDRITSVTSGTYNITGSDATTLFDRLTSVTSGAYNITGSDVTLLYEVPLTLVVTPGSYSITGSDVTFVYYALSVDPGAYNITGFDVRMDISAPIKGAQANLNARIEAIPTKAPNLTIPRPEYDVGQQMQFVNQLRLYFVGIDGATSSLAQITNTLSTLAWMDCN